MALFSKTHVEHLITEDSDNIVIIVQVLVMAPVRRQRDTGLFKFEEAWIRHEVYDSMVNDIWTAAFGGGGTRLTRVGWSMAEAWTSDSRNERKEPLGFGLY